MWRTAVPEAVDIGGNGWDLDSVDLGPLGEVLGVVDPLGARQDLLPSHKHVVTVAVPRKKMFKGDIALPESKS